jgi:hypothetical protein
VSQIHVLVAATSPDLKAEGIASSVTARNGNDLAAWRALLELGSTDPIRVDTSRLSGTDLIEVEECARRIGRMGQLTSNPLFIDISNTEGTPADDDLLLVFLSGINDTRCHAAVVCREKARIVRLLGTASYKIDDEAPLTMEARIDRTSIAYLATPVWIDPPQPPVVAGPVVDDQPRAGVKALEGV